MQKQKHFASSALIIQDRKALLVYHKKLGVWLYPGGHVENYENPNETVVREVKEETGLDVEIIGEKDDSLADASTDVSVLYNPYLFLSELVGDHYHNDLVYLCRIKDKDFKLKHDPKGSEGIGFFGLEDIDKLKLFPHFKRLLIKVLSE